MNNDPYQYQMAIDFFDTYTSEGYLTKEIQDIWIQKYNFLSKKNVHGNQIKVPVRKDVASILRKFWTIEKLIPLRNFERIKTKKGYLYFTKPRTTNHVLQTTLDFEQFETEDITSIDEIINTENNTENIPIEIDDSPLLQDVKAADIVYKTNMKLLSMLEKIEQFQIEEKEEINFSYITNNKKITVNITNI